MTNIAATTGTIRFRLDINNFNVSSVVKDGDSRAGAIVPEIHSHQIWLNLAKLMNKKRISNESMKLYEIGWIKIQFGMNEFMVITNKIKIILSFIDAIKIGNSSSL